MKLTAYTDYTLRTLMYLAVNDGRATTIADVANAYRISEAHLTKIVHQLGLAGDIETTRGRNGGIRLARSPADINLGAVVRRTEVDMDLVPCFGDTGSCAISGACLLKGILDEALTQFLTVLDRYTLADLITPHQPLYALLTLRSPSPPHHEPRRLRTMNPSIPSWRRQQRSALIAKRDTLTPAERNHAETAIAEKLDRLIEERASSVIGIYWPIRNEPNLIPWARALARAPARSSVCLLWSRRKRHWNIGAGSRAIRCGLASGISRTQLNVM